MDAQQDALYPLHRFLPSVTFYNKRFTVYWILVRKFTIFLKIFRLFLF